MSCSYLPSQDGSLAGMLDYVDCQAQTIGSQGYLALAAPGSLASLALTGLLTILVALYGYRLLFGEGPGVRDVVLTLVKVGIVVALATSWAAYRPLFYDVVLHGPAQITGIVGGAAGLPGATGGLAAHIDGTDGLFRALAIADQQPLSGYQPRPDVAPPPFAGFNAFALGWSRVTFLIGSVGAFAAVRLTAGLLLALGPLFAAFLLFEATRGLFIGWIRVLAGAALGAVATSIVLGVELAMLEPWLGDLLGRRSGGSAIDGAPAPLLAVTTIFGIALLATIAAAVRVTWSLDTQVLRWSTMSNGASGSNGVSADRAETGRASVHRTEAIAGGRSRAAALIDAVSAAERRESVYRTAGIAVRSAGRGAVVVQAASIDTASGRGPTLVAVSGRRTAGRVSAGAGRRDAR